MPDWENCQRAQKMRLEIEFDRVGVRSALVSYATI